MRKKYCWTTERLNIPHKGSWRASVDYLFRHFVTLSIWFQQLDNWVLFCSSFVGDVKAPTMKIATFRILLRCPFNIRTNCYKLAHREFIDSIEGSRLR